jgi:hypothetical protein
LSGTGDGKNNRPRGLLALPASYIMSVIGAVVSISGFIALVTARSVRTWVKGHPYPIYLALIVAVLVIAGTLNYAYNLRKRMTEPSSHDGKLYDAALARIPPNGAVIGWLKRAEMTEAGVTDFPADVVGALEKTIEFSRAQLVGFDDKRVAAAFESLIGAVTSFCQEVDAWTFAAQARQFRQIAAPPSGTAPSGESQLPGSPRTADATMAEETVVLARRHRDLVDAYDRFIRTAHARGIDTDG